ILLIISTPPSYRRWWSASPCRAWPPAPCSSNGYGILARVSPDRPETVPEFHAEPRSASSLFIAIPVLIMSAQRGPGGESQSVADPTLLRGGSTEMATTTDSLALDLGAESGRGLLGRFDGHQLALEEVHRFPNGPVKLLDTLYWDLPRLFEEIKVAL